MNTKCIFVPSILYPTMIVEVEPGINCTMSCIPLTAVAANTLSYVLRFQGEFLEADLPAHVDKLLAQVVDPGFLAEAIGTPVGTDLTLNIDHHGDGLVVVSVPVPAAVYSEAINALKAQIPDTAPLDIPLLLN